MAVFKEKLTRLEGAIHQVLSPLGFKKQKSNWRRSNEELLQQFSIVSQQLIASYSADWGLNVLSFSEDPKPLPHRLHVRWIGQETVKPHKRSLLVSSALDFESDFSDEERAKVINQMLVSDVLPCFEAFQTKESVRQMMGDWNFPRRASMFFNLPKDWWPPDAS